eukprot:4784170-Pleurochrysis_carterae.AAC.4
MWARAVHCDRCLGCAKRTGARLGKSSSSSKGTRLCGLRNDFRPFGLLNATLGHGLHRRHARGWHAHCAAAVARARTGSQPWLIVYEPPVHARSSHGESCAREQRGVSREPIAYFVKLAYLVKLAYDGGAICSLGTCISKYISRRFSSRLQLKIHSSFNKAP